MNFIAQLIQIRRQKQELAHKEAELTAPLLVNLEDVALVYQLFKRQMEAKEPRSLTESTHQRKKFIFVVLALFAPATLVGDRIPHGLRARIAQVTNINPSFISNNLENVLFQYQHFTDYRQELLYLCKEIANQLEISQKTTDFSF